MKLSLGVGLGSVATSGVVGGGAAPPAYSNSYATDYDGTDTYLDLGVTFETLFRSAFTVAFWVKLTDGQTSAMYTPNFFGSQPSGTDRLFANIDTSGYLAFYYKSDSNQGHAQSASAEFTDGQQLWVHLAYTVDSSNIKIYKNGAEVTLDSYYDGSMSGITMSSLDLESHNTYFGCRNHELDGAKYFLEGQMDEISFWDAALNSTRIAGIYNSGVPASLTGETNLAGYWRMEEGSGTDIADTSGEGNDATLANGSFVTDLPEFNQQSLYFNDIYSYLDMQTDHSSLFQDSFSVSLWVKLTEGQPSSNLTFFGNDDGIGKVEGFYESSNDMLQFEYNNGYGLKRARTTNTVWGSGDQEWAHLVFSINDSTKQMHIWMDGEDMGLTGYDAGDITGVDMSLFSMSSYLFVGAMNDCGSANTVLGTGGDAYLDELSFWSKALSTEEVSAIYNSGSPTDLTDESDLAGWWRFESVDTSAYTTPDSSSQSNTASTSNFMTSPYTSSESP